MGEAVIKYPDNLDSDESLIEVKDNKETQLTVAIDNAVTIIEVNDTSDFPVTGYISIDNEIIRYEEIDGNKFGTIAKPCIRGAQGTVAILHDAGDKVYLNVIAHHHNVLKDGIIKIEEELGTNPKGTFASVKERIQKLLHYDPDCKCFNVEQ